MINEFDPVGPFKSSNQSSTISLVFKTKDDLFNVVFYYSFLSLSNSVSVRSLSLSVAAPLLSHYCEYHRVLPLD